MAASVGESSLKTYQQMIAKADRQSVKAVADLLKAARTEDSSFGQKQKEFIKIAVESAKAVTRSLAQSLKLIQDAEERDQEAKIELLTQLIGASTEFQEKQIALIGQLQEIADQINERTKEREEDLKGEKQLLTQGLRAKSAKEKRPIAQEKAGMASEIEALEKMLEDTPQRVDAHFRQFFPMMPHRSIVLAQIKASERPFSLFN